MQMFGTGSLISCSECEQNTEVTSEFIKADIVDTMCMYLHKYSISIDIYCQPKVWNTVIIWLFLQEVCCSQRLLLFDQKHSKN